VAVVLAFLKIIIKTDSVMIFIYFYMKINFNNMNKQDKKIKNT